MPGIGISSTAEKKRLFAQSLLDRTIARYRLDVSVASGDLEIYDYTGAGYAKSRPEELDSITYAARRSGLVFDPVYTGKAFHGMMDLAARGIIRPDEQVLFFHTGGLLGLLAKSDTCTF